MVSRRKPRKADSADARSRPAEISNWLTRRQVAALVGLTEQQLEAMHGRELHPQRAADRSWRYSPSEVSALAVGGTVDGVVAAKVFALFEKDAPLPRVVIETQQTPARVNALRADYDAMVGSRVLSFATVEALRTMVGADGVSSEQALLSAIGVQLEARYLAGFREGREDAEDLGEVINPKTGARRRVTREPKS